MFNPFTRSNHGLSAIVVHRAPEAISTELDGETVILNMDTGVYSSLDQVGTAIWNAIEQPIAFQRLQNKMLSEYEVTAEQCLTDLCSFLQTLTDNRLIVIGEGKTV